MKSMNPIRLAAVMVMAAMAVAGCKKQPAASGEQENPGGQPEEKPKVESFVVPEDVYMYEGEVYRLKYRTVPKNADLTGVSYHLEFPHMADLEGHEGYVDISGLMTGTTKLYIECDVEDAYTYLNLHILDPLERLHVWTPADDGTEKTLEDNTDCVYGWLGKKDGYAAICMDLTAGDAFNAEKFTVEVTMGHFEVVKELSEDGTQVVFKLMKTLSFGKDEIVFVYDDERIKQPYIFACCVTSEPEAGIDADFSMTYRVDKVNETVRPGDTIYLQAGTSGIMYAKGSLALNWTSADGDILKVTPAEGKGDKYWATVVEFKAGDTPGSTSLTLRDQKGKEITLPVVVSE